MIYVEQIWVVYSHVHKWFMWSKQKAVNNSCIEQIELPAKLLGYFSWSNNSNINQSHVWMSPVMHESCHTCEYVTYQYEWVMPHIWMNAGNHDTNESCHICEYGRDRTHCEWVMPHIWMNAGNHVTHMNALCRICEWVMSHVWMSHVTRMSESCHSGNEMALATPSK